jgi:hypothetical protein
MGYGFRARERKLASRNDDRLFHQRSWHPPHRLLRDTCKDLRPLQRLCRKPVRRHIFSNAAAADAVRCVMRRM